MATVAPSAVTAVVASAAPADGRTRRRTARAYEATTISCVSPLGRSRTSATAGPGPSRSPRRQHTKPVARATGCRPTARRATPTACPRSPGRSPTALPGGSPSRRAPAPARARPRGRWSQSRGGEGRPARFRAHGSPPRGRRCASASRVPRHRCEPQLDAEKAHPEAARALGVIGRELEQGERRARHRMDDNVPTERAARRRALLRD